MHVGFLKGHLNAPAHDDPGQDLLRGDHQVGGEKGGGEQLAQRIAHQDPA